MIIPMRSEVEPRSWLNLRLWPAEQGRFGSMPSSRLPSLSVEYKMVDVLMGKKLRA